MRPINCIIREVHSEARLIRTFCLDRDLSPTPGQYRHGLDQRSGRDPHELLRSGHHNRPVCGRGH